MKKSSVQVSFQNISRIVFLADGTAVFSTAHGIHGIRDGALGTLFEYPEPSIASATYTYIGNAPSCINEPAVCGDKFIFSCKEPGTSKPNTVYCMQKEKLLWKKEFPDTGDVRLLATQNCWFLVYGNGPSNSRVQALSQEGDVLWEREVKRLIGDYVYQLKHSILLTCVSEREGKSEIIQITETGTADTLLEMEQVGRTFYQKDSCGNVYVSVEKTTFSPIVVLTFNEAESVTARDVIWPRPSDCVEAGAYTKEMREHLKQGRISMLSLLPGNDRLDFYFQAATLFYPYGLKASLHRGKLDGDVFFGQEVLFEEEAWPSKLSVSYELPIITESGAIACFWETSGGAVLTITKDGKTTRKLFKGAFYYTCHQNRIYLAIRHSNSVAIKWVDV